MLWLVLLMAPPVAPESVYESAPMKEARSLKESTAAAPAEWRTTAERTEYKRTGSYAEAVEFYRKLEEASKLVRLLPMGKTAEGRELYIFVVSKDGAFTPEQAARTGQPVVLLQNGIHPGENGGKDAAMMLLRDVLVTKRYAGWLDKVIILSIPVFNADGHEAVSPYNRINENGPEEMGFRVTGQRLNLNRDYMKADTPEMRAWLRMYSAWRPDFMIDNHVTDGSDYQWDVTVYAHTEGDIAAPVGRWVNEKYLKPFFGAMENDGHLVGWYAYGRGEKIPVATFSPRYSTGYAAARNRAALLVETHSLKSFRTRVWSHYDLMKVSLDVIAAEAESLKQASREADKPVIAGTKVLLEGRPAGEGEPYTLRLLESERYEGTAAGGPVVRYLAKPMDQPSRLMRTLEAKLELVAPAGYLIPPAWGGVLEVLRLHGVSSERLEKAVEAEVDEIEFFKPQFATRPFEGRFMVTSFTAEVVRTRRNVQAGWLYVPAGRLAMQLLEPEAPDSLLRWGFFQSIFEQKEYFSDYIFEPIAEKMLAENAELRKEFEAALAKDAAFASNPRARLAWLFERSPYFERGKDIYPVLRVIQKTW